MTAGWTAHYGYAYESSVGYFLGPINLYPFALWVVGLVVLREVYERIPLDLYWARLAGITVLYWVVLGVGEYIGFHVLGVRVTPSYPSLFGWGILHVPLFAQVYYLAAGPAYLLITDYLRVK